MVIFISINKDELIENESMQYNQHIKMYIVATMQKSINYFIKIHTLNQFKIIKTLIIKIKLF